MKNQTHFEHEHMSKHLDDGFHYITGGGHVGAIGGGFHAPVGGGFHAPAPTGGIKPTAPVLGGAKPALTPQQAHMRMVRNYFRHNPIGGYSYRNFRLTPLGYRWFRNRTGYLYGYSFAFLYPIFIDLIDGYDDEYLMAKYNLSGEEWSALMRNLMAGGYLVAY